jgi:hypothetical protein
MCRTLVMLCSFRASFTREPLLSVTSNSSTNQPPSEEMRALFTFRPSSVKCCTTCRGERHALAPPALPLRHRRGCSARPATPDRTSTSVPARLALKTDTVVDSPRLATSTEGGCTRSSSVSYSSSAPQADTPDRAAPACFSSA